MASFTYTARDSQGAVVEGVIEAPHRRDALRKLQMKDWKPLKVEEVGAAKKEKVSDRSSKENEPTAAECLPFLESMADLVRSGMSAGESLRLLSLRLQKSRLRNLCSGIWAKLGEGQSLSAAMGAYPAVFDGQTINLISAGEATGNIRDVLERLITHFTEQAEFRRKLVAAMAYPVFICFIAIGVVIFFVLYLLPRLQTLLTSLGGKLPLSTKLLINFADFFVVAGPLFLIALAVGAIGVYQWRKKEEGKVASDALLLKVPLMGSFVMRVSVLNFCQTLAVLLENGITTADALRLAEKTAPNRAMRLQMREATDRVLEGESLSRALARTGYFPRLLLDRVAVAEQTGNLAPGLRDIARSYRAELDRWLGAISQTISASVLIAAFSFVAFIAFAIVAAVFEVSASFRF
jgi:type II secretory pathway component PulF